MDGFSTEKKYFRQFKKIWSARYATDCLSGIFSERAKMNTVGVDDLPEYSSLIATADELARQNSHFQTEINKLRIAEE